MKVEFENIENGITITDAIIRDYPADLSDVESSKAHFQARIEASEMGEDDSFSCSFAYYSQEGEFLGLDSDSIWAGDITLKHPYSISFELYPPDNVELVKCQIGIRRCKMGLWDFAWPAFVLLIFILVISSIINIWL